MTEVCAIMKQKTLGINQASGVQSQIFLPKKKKKHTIKKYRMKGI